MTERASGVLKWVLGFNLALSVASGLTATLASGWVSTLIGFGPAWLILGVGLGLLLFAAGIAWTLLRLRIGQALIISVLDLLWVVGTLPLLLVPGLLTDTGAALVVSLAVLVGSLGVLQSAAIRALLKEDEGEGRYRHCIRVASAAPPDALWRVVRNLGSMARYSAGLSASRLDGGPEPAPGTARVCTNHQGQSWTEEVQELSDSKRRVFLRFQSEAEDFPFPLAKLSGGWSVTAKGGGGSLVDVWWNVTPHQKRFGWMLVALMAMALDRDVPKIVAAMEADALGAAVPRSSPSGSLDYC